jgi:raffinose/stachyose/melibiose transport system permease protein
MKGAVKHTLLRHRKNWWRYLLTAAILLLYLAPFYILIGVAFKMPSDPSSRWILPNYLYFDNFAKALEGRILLGLRGSLTITAFSVTLIICIGALAAYPLARNKSKLNLVVRGFIMGVMMVPPLSILVPIYSVMKAINGISTYYGMILLLLTFQLPLSIFIYSNFIASIPIALDEAACIDGCGPLRTFVSIILPQLAPVTASVAILTGVTCWNDYQFSLYILQRPQVASVTLAVSDFFAQTSSNIFAAAAAALLGLLPITVMFLLLQKHFIKGMVDSAIK